VKTENIFRKEEGPTQGAKIIPFPGVSLPEPEATYQNGLEDFLREMGYIE